MKLNEIKQLYENETLTDHVEIKQAMKDSDSDDPLAWSYREGIDYDIMPGGIVKLKHSLELNIEDSMIKNGKLIIKFGEVNGNVEYVGTKLTSFDNFPRVIRGNLTFHSKCITSLEDIANHIDRIDGNLCMKLNSIQSGGVTLLSITNLSGIYQSDVMDVHVTSVYGLGTSPWFIINQYLQSRDPEERQDIFGCQEELIKHGLEEYAK